MIAAPPDTHIRIDKSGVAWLDRTNVKVIEVIMDHLTYGHSPEEIQLQHRHLSLAQVYAAFTYYYDHQVELDSEIGQRYRKVETLRKKATHQPSRKKLLARLHRR